MGKCGGKDKVMGKTHWRQNNWQETRSSGINLCTKNNHESLGYLMCV